MRESETSLLDDYAEHHVHANNLIAPFFETRERTVEKPPENARFSAYLKNRPSGVLSNVSNILSGGTNILSVLMNTLDCLKYTTKSCGGSVYMVDEARNEITLVPKHFPLSTNQVKFKIGRSSTVAAYVALTKEFLLIEDIIKETRFPNGLGNMDLTVKSVLCVPILATRDTILGIFELYRNSEQGVYQEEDLRMLMIMCTWVASAMFQQNERIALKRQRDMHKYLMDLIECYFADTILLENVVSEITNYAKKSLGAEHASLYILDKRVDDIYADVFEEAIDDSEKLIKKNAQKKLDTEGSVAGFVAHNCGPLNIRNVYNDKRFSISVKNEYVSRAVLCYPIMGTSEMLGVIQLVNKKYGGCFTKSDENLLQVFLKYFSLVISFSKRTKKIENLNNYNYLYRNMLTFHMQPCEHDTNFVISHQLPGIPEHFNQFDFCISESQEPYMIQLLMYMFTEIAPNLFTSYGQMLNFLLTVKKGYRNLPYHNFFHAFMVCHTAYNIIRRNLSVFSWIETWALMLGSLCHDIDHFGRTNAFLIMIDHPLAQLYETSPMENHHFQITMLVIKDLSLLSDLSTEQYNKVISQIRDCIIATDLSLYFHNRGLLYDICSKNIFDFKNDRHRHLLKSTIMTLSDLSASCKPFLNVRKITQSLYEEFYDECDERKKLNAAALPLMDRKYAHKVPGDQVKFTTIVVLPCALILTKILPNCESLYLGAIKVREAWKEIAEVKDKKLWRQEAVYEKTD